MIRAALLLPFLALPAEAFANPVACGGNSFSFAEVETALPGEIRTGPVEVLPHSLCPDIVERRPRSLEAITIDIAPGDGTVVRKGADARVGTSPARRPVLVHPDW